MRKSLVDSLIKCCSNEKFCILCGDLGYNALEPLKASLGERFINAGIAEQNMLSVAAGLAEAGMKPWVYSISPFIYARAFEQIRNDICLQNLPVTLIGSGAGFGYGNAGPSHHALEDCGAMAMLQNMTVFTPVCKNDFATLTPRIISMDTPVYIRLGRDEIPSDFRYSSEFTNYRRLFSGNKGVILALGAIAGMAIEVYEKMEEKDRPAIWCCGKLPVIFSEIPQLLFRELSNSSKTIILEDHVATGGLGEQFSKVLLKHHIEAKNLSFKHAIGYFDGNYGCQDFYRAENQIDKNAIRFDFE